MSRRVRKLMGHPDREALAIETGLLVLLQNAWSPVYAGLEWPRQSWLPALARSHTGRRLRIAMGKKLPPECCWNVNPICGASSSSKLKPDLGHVRNLMTSGCPRVVLACGKVAEGALMDLQPWPQGLGVLLVPHPAARPVSNSLFRRVGELLVEALGRAAEEPIRMRLKLRRPRIDQDQNWTEGEL